MAGGNVLEFDDSNFDTDVLESDVPVLVDFWAEWCGPCQMIAPTIEEIADEYQGKIKVGKLDTDKAPQTAAKFGVQNIPTVLIFQNGEPVERLVGAKKKSDYQAALNAKISDERRLSRPLLGPHLDRLRILWGETDVSEIASAGERKGLGLLFLIAQFLALEGAGRTPIVLADDVDSELDRDSFQRLWNVLRSAPQVFASSNRPEVWETLDVSHRWSVRRGSIDPWIEE